MVEKYRVQKFDCCLIAWVLHYDIVRYIKTLVPNPNNGFQIVFLFQFFEHLYLWSR